MDPAELKETLRNTPLDGQFIKLADSNGQSPLSDDDLQDILAIPGSFVGGGIERMSGWRSSLLHRLKDAADNPPELPQGSPVVAAAAVDGGERAKCHWVEKLPPAASLDPASAGR